MEDLMIKIENVSKTYKLGQIGGTTLRDELQRLHAKLHKKEDPTKRIGAKNYNKGEKFNALTNVSFEVKKGERVGIIGHNGAGKSTLLKLLSRVTAPTEGSISLNGRIASMLEVGTGFHAELTGRENIYINGAILGMTKKEIDAKMEDIIEFSEVRQFIDTPVKRYSSGMYVKLAFAVAAHLDSEIMVMDEVLAVGDMKFQEKCLGKMDDVSKNQGRTILYVSHNMNTVRSLCTRVVVLDHGKVVFDGGVEEGIAVYSACNKMEEFTEKDLTNAPRYVAVKGHRLASFTNIKILDGKDNILDYNEKFRFKLTVNATKKIENVNIRLVFWDRANIAVASIMKYNLGEIKIGENNFTLEANLDNLVGGVYNITLVLFEKNAFGISNEIDVVQPAFSIEKKFNPDIIWAPGQWGRIRLNEMKLIENINAED